MDKYMALKIKPDGDPSQSVHFDLTNTFALHFFPEGYTDRSDFEDDIRDLMNKTASIAPFTVLNQRDSFSFLNICVYAYWPATNDGDWDMPVENIHPAPSFSIDSEIPEYTSPWEFNSAILRHNMGGVYSYQFVIDSNKIRATIRSYARLPVNSGHGDGTELNVADYLQKSVLLSDGNGRTYSKSNSVVFVLMPDSQFKDTDFNIDLRNDGLVDTKEDDFDIYLTTNDTYGGSFIARAIGRNLGLADETVADPGIGAPASDFDKAVIEFSPNLIYDPIPNATSYTISQYFKWKEIAANTMISLGINETGAPATPQNYFKLKVLWRGGYEFSQQVYRSAPDCLMHRRLSTSGVILPKSYPPMPNEVKARVNFCPVCQAFVERMVDSRNYIGILQGKVTLQTQKSVYNLVKWQSESEAPKGSNGSFNTHPGGIGNEEFWAFKYSTDASYGLKITEVDILQQQRPANRIDHSAYPVGNVRIINTLEFHNLKVKWRDGTEEAFPLAAAFSNPKSKFTIAANSDSAYDRKLFQRGLKLVLFHDFNGACNVTVELSVAFRSIKNDFDPGGAAYALKFYPQITFKWEPADFSPGGPSRKYVADFYGEVYIEEVTKHNGGLPDCTGEYNNVELFSDANYITGGGMTTRRHKYYVPTSLVTPNPIPSYLHPQWSMLFDAYKAYTAEIPTDPNLTFPFEFTAVYGPDEPTKHGMDRETTLPGFPSSGYNFKVTRVKRQGPYDNIHVTGDMMNYDFSGIDTKKLIAAPFCAEDCIHSHWRWGALANYITVANNPLTPFAYLGWMPDPRNSVANTIALQPLIPPNQSLKINVGAAVTGGLYAIVKKLTYKCKVHSADSGINHVVLEPGMAWAARVGDVSIVRALFTILDTIDSIDSNVEDYAYMRAVYNRIRFYDNHNPGTTLIPLGYTNNLENL